MAQKEQAGPYVPGPCKRCGGAPVLEYNGHYRSAIRSRMRCPACGACTDWCRTRFQAEMEWEEMQEKSGGTRHVREMDQEDCS